MRLYLVRHGQTPANVAGELDTAPPGAELTDLGHTQAASLVEALSGERVVAVHASPLTRARLTAAPLATALGLEVSVSPGLAEIRAGDLELRADEASVSAFLGCLSSWMHGDLGRTMPGATDGYSFLDRYDAAVREIARDVRPEDTVVAVSHGAAIRTYSAVRAAGLDPHDVSRRRIANTGAVVLDGHPGEGWRLVRWVGEPLGGIGLAGQAAHDVTGQAPAR